MLIPKVKVLEVVVSTTFKPNWTELTIRGQEYGHVLKNITMSRWSMG